MPHPLFVGSFTHAKALEKAALKSSESTFTLQVKRAYYGDLWQDGEWYTGPKPLPDALTQSYVWAKIKALFTSKNVIAEITKRQAGAVLSQQPRITFDLTNERELVANPDALAVQNGAPKMVPRPLTPAEEKLLKEAQEAFMLFWNRQEVHKLFKDFMSQRLWGGRACLRLFIPSRYENKRATTLLDAIKQISLEKPDIENCRVLDDKSSGFSISITVLPSEDEKDRSKSPVEIVFTDDDDKTFIATLDPGEEIDNGTFNADNVSSPLELDGDLTVYQTEGQPLITPQIVSLNKFINLCLTMAGHVTVETGHSEMALLNVDLPDETIKNPDGTTIKRPRPIYRGAGAINNFVGVLADKSDGSQSYAAPGVVYKEPSPLTSHVEGKELGYVAILEECHQLHARITGDAATSGESRIQALVDFVGVSLEYQEEVDAAGLWLMSTVIRMAAAIAGQSELIKGIKPVFQSKVFVGPLTPGERSALLTEVEKKLRSKRNARLLLGIDDSDAEQAEIDRETREGMALAAQLPLPGTGNPNNPPDPKQPPKPDPAKDPAIGNE